MRVLVATNMWPSPTRPHWGAFVRSQVESLTALGVENTLYEIEGWRNAAHYAKAMIEIPARARAIGADLVHAHHGLTGIAATRVTVPLVVSFCGDDLLGQPDEDGQITMQSQWLIGISRRAARRAEAVIVKSEEMRRCISEIPEVEVIPNGVDLARFAPIPREHARARLGWVPDGAVLLFAANPEEPRKNFALAEEVERRLRQRGRVARLEWIYDRTQDEVALAMSAADVLLLPSFHEGSPNTVKEAMAAGLPVVAAPVGDCEERLRGCAPGAVVAREPEAFTAATEAVLGVGARSNGRERVATLSLESVAQRVLRVYERVLSKRRTRTGRA